MRQDGRALDQLRPVTMELGFTKFAEGSCLIRAGDTVVLAGKGHETYQEVNHQKFHMDEREIVAEHLNSGR